MEWGERCYWEGTQLNKDKEKNVPGGWSCACKSRCCYEGYWGIGRNLPTCPLGCPPWLSGSVASSSLLRRR